MQNDPLYIPPEFAAFRFAQDVEHLSFVRHSRADFLVTGGVDSAIINLSNEHAWQAYKAEGNQHWCGAAIGPCFIEVDYTSTLPERDQDAPVGSVLRRGKSTYLVARSPTFGFASTWNIPVVLDNSDAEQTNGIAFARWRLLVRAGEEKLVVAEFVDGKRMSSGEAIRV